MHKRESYKNEVKKKSSNKSNNTFINKKIVCEECKAIVKFKNSLSYADINLKIMKQQMMKIIL